MRRVVFNQKGGVGKSSITCNLAAISAASGKRTLVVDLDRQGNSTHYLLGLHPDELDTSIADYFKACLRMGRRRMEPLEYAYQSPFENLCVIPASSELDDLQTRLESRHKIYKLRDLLDELTDEFDEIYIDTPPVLNFYTLSTLIAADRSLIPFDCDAFSRDALCNILDAMEDIREDHNPDLVLEGIVVNMFQSNASLPTRIVEELKAEGQPLLPVYLSYSVKMKESHESCRPLIYLAPSHKLTRQFIELHDHLNRRKR